MSIGNVVGNEGCAGRLEAALARVEALLEEYARGGQEPSEALRRRFETVAARFAATTSRATLQGRDAELLKLAMAVARAGAWEWNVPSNTVMWSEENYRLFGLEPNSVEPSYALWLSFVHPEDREDAEADVRKALEEGRDLNTIYRLVRADGKVRWINDIGRLFVDDSGAAVRMVGFQIDITDQRRLQDRLHQAQKMEAVGRLAGSIAHDFNNLLTVIRGNAALLSESQALPELADITSAVERATDLTRQLLFFSRKMPLRLRALDVNEALTEARKLIDRLIGEDIDLSFEVCQGPLHVWGDLGQLTQVILNLALNARDAMPEGGSLKIVSRVGELDEPRARDLDLMAGSYCELVVSDSGEGMSDKLQSRIFEPFFTTKQEGLGTGLGLATVKRIVEECDGAIELRSAPGAGTRFSIFLPRIEQPTDELRVPVEKTPTLDLGSVLLVEDEPQIRRLVKSYLRRQGVWVVDAASPSLAVEAWNEAAGGFDVLLVDVVMPEMSGPELAKLLRQECPELVVVFMTGYPGERFSGRYRLDAEAYLLSKPFNHQQLATILQEAWGTRSLMNGDGD